jgi:hypothetical protein
LKENVRLAGSTAGLIDSAEPKRLPLQAGARGSIEFHDVALSKARQPPPPHQKLFWICNENISRKFDGVFLREIYFAMVSNAADGTRTLNSIRRFTTVPLHLHSRSPSRRSMSALGHKRHFIAKRHALYPKSGHVRCTTHILSAAYTRQQALPLNFH